MVSISFAFQLATPTPINGYRVRYRLSGSSGAYITVTGTTSPFFINGLDNNSVYEYLLDSDCNGSFSSTTSGNFSTGSSSIELDHYDDAVIAFMNATSLTNNSTVLYTGTPQQKTALDIKNALNSFAITLRNAGLLTGENAFDAIYPCIGNTSNQNSINFINPSLHQLVFPNGIGVSSFGITSELDTQYAGTGILPYQDLYSGFGTDVMGYPSSTDSAYLAMFCNGKNGMVGCDIPNNSTSFMLKASTITGEPLRFDAFSTYPNSSLAGSVVSYDVITRAGFVEGNRIDRVNSTIYSTEQETTTTRATVTGTMTLGTFPSNEIKISGNSPISFVFIRRKGLTDIELAAVRSAVSNILTTLNRWQTVPDRLQAPGLRDTLLIPAFDNVLKGFTFTTTTESREVSDYEVSTFDGTNWSDYLTMSDDFLSNGYNARQNFVSGAGWGATSRDYSITYYVNNTEQLINTIKIRAKAKNGKLASTAITNTSAFTHNDNFDRWKPAHLTYYTEGRFNKCVAFTPAVLSWIEHTGFEVTYDGGSTTQPLKFMVHYTDNRDVATGQFGIRCINKLTGEALSDWLFSTVDFTSSSVTQITMSGLKQFDSSVTATTVENSNQITVSNNNYNFQIGQKYGFLGAGRRGARGVGGEWPLYRFSSLDAANTALSNNPNTYVANQYGWEEATGKVIRIDGGKTHWDFYSDNLPDVNLAQALPLVTTITNVVVNGNSTVTLTVDKTAKFSESNVAVYFDNSKVIQDTLNNIVPFSEVTFPTGNYSVLNLFNLPVDKTGTHLKMRGFTFFAPPKSPSASFTLYAIGSKINKYAGNSVTVSKGNYNFNDMGFRIWEGDSSQWTDLYLPTLDQVLGAEYTIYNSCFRFEGIQIEAYDIEAWDGPGAVIANACNGGLVQGFKIKRTNIIPLITSEGRPYSGSYYWAAYIDTCKGATIDGASIYGNTPTLNIDQPVWLNSYEIFKSVDGTIRNIVAKNGMGSCNGSAGATYKNVTNTIQAGSKYFQNTGHSGQEMNLFMGAPDGWKYTLYENYHLIFEGSLINGENWYPIGFNLTTGVAGAHVINCSYTRPNMVGYPTAPGFGLKMQGVAAYVDGFIYTGDWDEQYLTDAFGFGGSVDGSSIRLTEQQGKATDAIIKNCSAPTISLPSSMDSSNVINNTATQRSYIYYPSIWLRITNQTSNSVTLNISEFYNKEGIIQYWYWSKVNGPSGTMSDTGNGYETVVTELTAGDYDFRLTVLNSNRVYGSQDIQFTIE